VGLPLSFVPTSLLVLVATHGKSGFPKRIIEVLLVSLTLLFGVRISDRQELIKFPEQYYNIRNANPYMTAIKNIINDLKYSNIIILDFNTASDIFFFLNYIKTNKEFKVGIVSCKQYFISSNLLPIILSNNIEYAYISNKTSNNIINGDKERKYGVLRVTRNVGLRKQGYVEVKGINWEGDWAVINDWILLKIVVPEELKGKEARLTARLRGGDQTPEPLARLTVNGLEENLVDQSDWRTLTALVPGTLTEKGLIIASVLLSPKSPKTVEGGDIYLERVELTGID
jgi:hypothetical protein